LSHALGYEISDGAPGTNTPGVGLYIAGHNMIKAHARVYQLYAQYRDKQQGEFYELPSENIAFGCCSWLSYNSCLIYEPIISLMLA